MAGLEKKNWWILALLILPLFMAILPVKYPCTLTIISRGAPLVLLVVVGHGGCYKVFGIKKTGFLVTHSGSSLRTSWVGSHQSHFTLTCSISWDGSFYHICDKSYLTWRMNLLQSHYHLHCSGSWNQPASKPFWSTAEWPQCMPSQVKVGIETFLCWQPVPTTLNPQYHSILA